MSGLKKVGKIALKVAPYAAMAIPGIGIPASMAIQAGLGAANAKAGGAGWKGVLAGAGIGAGTGAVTGGLGPSGNVVKNAVSDTANKALGGGLKGTLLNIGKTTAGNMLGTGSTKTDIVKGVLSRAAQMGSNQPSATGATQVAGVEPRLGQMPSPSDNYPGGFGQNFGEDQNNPNLANSINQGKLDAQRTRRPLIPSQRAYGY
jgi:hypothetical protein